MPSGGFAKVRAETTTLPLRSLPNLIGPPEWMSLAPPAFTATRPGGARVKAGGAFPLAEPELSPASLCTPRNTHRHSKHQPNRGVSSYETENWNRDLTAAG